MPEMTHYNLTTAVAVAALTFGIAGPRLAPDEVAPALSESDIVVAMDETATDEDSDSAKMDKDAAAETGGAEETSDTDTKKVDQPERQDDGTMDGAGEESQ
ncbi:hypothetical protein AUC71_08400 [Methyloceanibacter marginalis]|jgi:hypothetical protein|uniref:Uncharacterized protein n=2 Tax=Methyloceanibacter marginalis TaxID=1774971 RepID=A0A1E3WCW7_9HYPH|nr:hypothetical protein AUC71_08400 [Methyloceanibacter marginalis]